MRIASVVAVAVVAPLIACADKAVAPPTVAAIAVTSPIGNRLAVGRTTQLGAEARDAAGAAIDNVTVTWTSSAATATVNATGLISGIAAGSSTISATGGGVTGTLAMQVVDADLPGITTTVNDAFAQSLLANLTVPVRTAVELGLAQIQSGVLVGNFTTIETGLATARSQVTGAMDPTDRALLASLALYLDRIQALMNL
jgi:hypothetical protein